MIGWTTGDHGDEKLHEDENFFLNLSSSGIKLKLPSKEVNPGPHGSCQFDRNNTKGRQSEVEPLFGIIRTDSEKRRK